MSKLRLIITDNLTAIKRQTISRGQSLITDLKTGAQYLCKPSEIAEISQYILSTRDIVQTGQTKAGYYMNLSN